MFHIINLTNFTKLDTFHLTFYVEIKFLLNYALKLHALTLVDSLPFAATLGQPFTTLPVRFNYLSVFVWIRCLIATTINNPNKCKHLKQT